MITYLFHPGFIMILLGILVAVLPSKAGRAVYVAAPVAALCAVFGLKADSSFIYNAAEGISLQFINADRLAYIFLMAYCIISIIGTVYSLTSESSREKAAALIYAGCNMSVVLARDCISLIAFWELSAIASAYLVYSGHCRKSTRATFRYLLVHAFGGTMLLVGFLLYISHFGNSLDNISALSSMPTFWIIFIGAAVNAAVPPINSWLPDAYPESTIGGTVFLGSFTTKTAIYLLIRLFAGSEWLVWVGAFMAIYGVVMALLENDLRRLFCYHIISQLGYMIASLAMGGAWGIDGAAAHAFNNIMYKGTLLMCAGAVIYATGKRRIDELGGFGRKMPVTAVCFLIASFAISGVPFLNGFASKALIMHAVEAGGYKLAFLLLTAASVGTWLSIALKVNYFVFWGKTDKDVEVRDIPVSMKAGMILGSAVCVVTGIAPKLVYNIAPNMTDAAPFTLEHILEYIILFVGATIVFRLLIGRMQPHNEVSLDFDWFYRRPFAALIDIMAKGSAAFFGFFAKLIGNGADQLRIRMGDPYLQTKNSSIKFIRDMSWENEDRLVGDIITVIVGVGTVMIIVLTALS